MWLASCSAGPPAADSPDDRDNDLVARRAAQIHDVREAAGDELSAAAEELEAELFLTDAGKVIARAIRAHGGWDAWLALGGIGYRREELLTDETGKLAPSHAASSRDFAFRVSAQGRLEPLEGGDGSGGVDEAFHAALPFVLARLEGRREYLGVESDARTDELFEKIRCERGTAGGGWFVAYFDYSTYLLKRITEERNGNLRLTVLSKWTEVGGVKTPTQRSHFRLRSRFQHRDMGRPDAIDVLTELAASR